MTKNSQNGQKRQNREKPASAPVSFDKLASFDRSKSGVLKVVVFRQSGIMGPGVPVPLNPRCFKENDEND